MRHRGKGFTGRVALRHRMVGAIRNCFRRREILIRSGGGVRYIALPVPAQLLLLLMLGAAAGWIGHTSYAYLAWDDVAARNRELLATIARMRNEFSDVAGTLERNHSELQMLLAQNGELRSELGEVRTRLAAVETDRDAALRRQAALSHTVQTLEGKLAGSERRSAALNGALESTRAALAQARSESGAAERARESLRNRVASLEQRLGQLRESQNNLLGRATERTAAEIEKVERIVGRIGLDLGTLIPRRSGKMLARTEETDGEGGRGGPFIPLPEKGGANGAEVLAPLVVALRSYDRHLAKYEEMQRLLRSLPLAAPLEQYKLSSGHGRRSDPINGKPALHEGIDLSAPSRTPVHATAPGTVVFAGWNGRYGRMVEIDHGYGIRTRYAHLQRIMVRRGQQVHYWHAIGQVGSSGRSTGAHLHYEVVVGGKSLDPERFMRAGKDVFKG